MSEEKDTPTVFGRPMVPGRYSGVFRYDYGDVRLRVFPSGQWLIDWKCTLSQGQASSPDEAARAIEARLRELVMALIPLLDEAGKAEVFRLTLPKGDFLPRDFDGEPEPLV